ncbi:MAG: MFS transporter [Phycisphaerales bacterium]|nr:MFS transporter [Phycisphaerales bacterium]
MFHLSANRRIQFLKSDLLFVIINASIGSIIEFYDFFIFIVLSPLIAKNFFFFSKHGDLAYIYTLLVFTIGFIARPIGGLLFGYLGDFKGRKYAFVYTVAMISLSTFCIGLIPSSAKIGIFAGIFILLLRFIQGIALGGEYGNASTYLFEHAPLNKKGYFLSWIQITGTTGMILALLTTNITKHALSPLAYEYWGWRLPFLLSAPLFLISVYFRAKTAESPIFLAYKQQRLVKENPFRAVFAKVRNFKNIVFFVFVGAAGVAAIDITSLAYQITFLENTLHIQLQQTNLIVIIAYLISIPFFIFFGYLSDRIDKKWLIASTLFLGIILLRPLFSEMYTIAHTQSNVQAMPIAQNYALTNQTVYNAQSSIRTNNKVEHAEDKSSANHITDNPLVLTTQGFLWMLLLTFILRVINAPGYTSLAPFVLARLPNNIRVISYSTIYNIGYGIFAGLIVILCNYGSHHAYILNATAINQHLPTPYQQPYLVGLWYPILVGIIALLLLIVYVPNQQNRKTNVS